MPISPLKAQTEIQAYSKFRILLLLPLITGRSLQAALAPAARQAPLSEPTLPTGAKEVAGIHVIVHALPTEQANARYLAGIGDAALEIYARDLGVAIPRDPIHIYLLNTIQDYEQADSRYNGGTTRYNQGFTQGGRVFLHLGPRPGQTVLESGSMLTRLLYHEICHALHQRLFLNYRRQPCWLVEGLADAWAERACSGTASLMAERSPQQSTMLITLRRAAQQGDSLSISQLLSQPQSAYGSEDLSRQLLTYARSFALVRMLDDPAPENAARRLKFRAFLREANSLTGDDIAAQINARFLQQFGGIQLAELQAEYRRRITTEKVFPWELYTSDLVTRPDGALLAEAAANRSALAFAYAPPLAPSAHLHARIETTDLGHRQANLLFGRTAFNDYYMVAFGPRYVTLLRHQQTYQTLANRNIDPSLFAPGSHTLDLYLRPQQVEARLDGRIVATFDLQTPNGQWGIGATDARILFRDMAAQLSPPETAPISLSR